MNATTYTRNKPTEPGWYWCRNIGYSEVALICRVDRSMNIEANGKVTPAGLCASWMTQPGKAGLLFERDWSPDVEWAGPIFPPGESTEESQ